MSLSITIGGKNLAFLPTGDVAIVAAGGAQTVNGAWRTVVTGAEPQDNKVHYTLDGAAQPPIQALYSVNDSNQLQAVMQAADGTKSAASAFLGGIEIDDAHHLIYNLMDSAGKDLAKSITVYGSNFRFEDG